MEREREERKRQGEKETRGERRKKVVRGREEYERLR